VAALWRAAVLDDQQGTQTFTYDPLNRVLTSTLGSIKRAYSYDSNGNRLTVSQNDLLADTFVFDTTDQTISNTAGDVTTYFSYDRYGSLLSSRTSAASSTSYTFDLADRLTAITQPDGTAVVFAFDAAGRHESRTATASDSTTITDTYAYLGTTNSVLADTSSAGVARTVYAAIDSMGNRLASRSATTGGTIVWVIPDLHGNVVAQCSPGGSSITDAFRYDPYGKLIGTPASVGAIASPWRFQGRLLMSTTDSANADVYDFSARAYIPDLGTFASLDTVTGSAQNPLTLNRYLYALGNPATMVDPDGHCSIDPNGWLGCLNDAVGNAPTVGGNLLGMGGGFLFQTPGVFLRFGQGLVGLVTCLDDTSCGIQGIKDAIGTFQRDPGGSILKAGSNLAYAGAAVAQKFDECKAANDYFRCGQESAEVFWNIEITVMGPKVIPKLPKIVPGLMRNIPNLVRNLPRLAKTLPSVWRTLRTEGFAAAWLDLKSAYFRAYWGESSVYPGSGAHVPTSAAELQAAEHILKNPGLGKDLELVLKDPRWPGARGWAKYRITIGNTNYHYMYNAGTGAIEDIKIKELTPKGGRH
jgi:RHS repeat-associated protein